eukprot:9806887-Lingulodinium_polyedra.AAC.1
MARSTRTHSRRRDTTASQGMFPARATAQHCTPHNRRAHAREQLRRTARKARSIANHTRPTVAFISVSLPFTAHRLLPLTASYR